jgi:hypothetical protein
MLEKIFKPARPAHTALAERTPKGNGASNHYSAQKKVWS